MSTAFAGEIRLISGQYIPPRWALCQGQSLPIAQYQRLFNLIGTKFGGDGVTTFKLPDFSGRAPLGMGAAPDRSPVVVGEAGGAERVELTNGQLPNHTHVASTAVLASTSGATLTHPQGAVPAVAVGEDGRTPVPLYAPLAAADTTLSQCFVQVQPAGLSEPVTVRNPYLGLNFIIALEDGDYPGYGTIGEIRMSSFDQFPDRSDSGWRLCDGASVPIEGDFKALYSLVVGPMVKTPPKEPSTSRISVDAGRSARELPRISRRSTGVTPAGLEQVVLTKGQMPSSQSRGDGRCPGVDTTGEADRAEGCRAGGCTRRRWAN